MSEWHRGEWENIGHGNRVRRVFQPDGTLDAIDWDHGCKVVNAPDYIPVTPPNGWKLESEHPLTISPSLLCRACQCHGFIRDGKWVPV